MSTDNPTRELQELQVSILDQEECYNNYEPITDEMMCAGVLPYYGKKMCQVSALCYENT